MFQNSMQILRKEKGFSQEVLAEKIGVTRQAMAKWEKKKLALSFFFIE
jgi:DNA-binding XRE family transcriptional regulator